MIVRVGTSDAINEIRVICLTLLYILINKQKHATTDTKAPRVTNNSSKRGRPPKNDKVNPCSEKYFETDDKKPGDNPANLLVNYEEALNEFKYHKLILDNKLFIMQLEPAQNPLYIKIREVLTKDDNYFQGKEDIKTCDDAYAVYLRYCSEKVNAEFFKMICKYIILYREAFNQYGPDKYYSEDPKNPWEIAFYSTWHKRYFEKSFSELVTPEYLPDIANELYIFFQFQYKKLKLTKDLMKELTLNFTSWLNRNELTTAKVVL